MSIKTSEVNNIHEFFDSGHREVSIVILTSVRIKKVNFRENIGTDSFVCLKEKLHMGVCRK